MSRYAWWTLEKIGKRIISIPILISMILLAPVTILGNAAARLFYRLWG